MKNIRILLGYENPDDFEAKKNCKKLSGCNHIEIFPKKKYDKFIEIYETYFTPSHFYKIINCQSKINFDKIINTVYNYIDLKKLPYFDKIYDYYSKIKISLNQE